MTKRKRTRTASDPNLVFCPVCEVNHDAPICNKNDELLQSFIPPLFEPIKFTYRVGRGESFTPFVGGVLTFELPDDTMIEVEAYIRPGEPIGLAIRGLDCSLDIESRLDNKVIVKPRPR